MIANCFAFLLVSGGDPVRNIRSDQFDANRIRILWDLPTILSPRGYRLTVDSIRLNTTLNPAVTSYVLVKLPLDRHMVQVSTISQHYPPNTVTHYMTFRGETSSRQLGLRIPDEHLVT